MSDIMETTGFESLLKETPEGWTVIFEPITAAEAYKTFASIVVSYEHSNNDLLAGFTNAHKKTIHLFFKGMRSHGTMRWTLAHELGHADHYENNPKSLDWTSEQREAHADHYANELLNRLGL